MMEGRQRVPEDGYLPGPCDMTSPHRYPYDDAPQDKILIYRPSKQHLFYCQVCLKGPWTDASTASRHGAKHCEERGWERKGRVVTHTGPRPYSPEKWKEYRRRRNTLRMRAKRREQRQQAMPPVSSLALFGCCSTRQRGSTLGYWVCLGSRLYSRPCLTFDFYTPTEYDLLVMMKPGRHDCPAD